MSADNLTKTQERIRSPRSAAAAGILFTILTISSMVLMGNVSVSTADDINQAWLVKWPNYVSIVLVMIPFAGIAFLWFTGVIRDWLGHREDHFFATVFLGSAILFVGLVFVWAAVIGALLGTITTSGFQLNDGVLIFGMKFMDEILGNFVVRMAGVYMMSIASLWSRTKVAPRWLVILTFIVALGFLFFATAFRGAQFIFPLWVLLVSIYILILNYRITDEEPGTESD